MWRNCDFGGASSGSAPFFRPLELPTTCVHFGTAWLGSQSVCPPLANPVEPRLGFELFTKAFWMLSVPISASLRKEHSFHQPNLQHMITYVITYPRNHGGSRGFTYWPYNGGAFPMGWDDKRFQRVSTKEKHDWLVVDLPLWKIWKSVGIILHNIYIYMIWKNKHHVPNHLPDEKRSQSFCPHAIRPWSTPLHAAVESLGRGTKNNATRF